MTRCWYVYLLGCADETIYTGITLDLTRRLAEHNGAQGGSRYTRTRRPVKLLVAWQIDGHGPALEVEYYIKHRLKRRQKQELISNPLQLARQMPTINLRPVTPEL